MFLCFLLTLDGLSGRQVCTEYLESRLFQGNRCKNEGILAKGSIIGKKRFMGVSQRFEVTSVMAKYLRVRDLPAWDLSSEQPSKCLL